MPTAIKKITNHSAIRPALGYYYQSIFALIGLFDSQNEDSFVSIETLETLTEVPSLKDEELDVIGELISNMYGAIEVNKMIKEGTPKKEAVNNFMKRVLGSIDK
ncbi:hypothetical protein [Olleya sp. ITB9]|uniref:DUF6952 family protein n=1 Tax=Olleya sp. ITB9 TaxID=1715648 RepID=UPI000B03FDC2|nr:hypothetical protein [Olleya sp. ITB9]